MYFMGLNLSNQQIVQELDLDFEFVHNVRNQGIALPQPC